MSNPSDITQEYFREEKTEEGDTLIKLNLDPILNDNGFTGDLRQFMIDLFFTLMEVHHSHSVAYKLFKEWLFTRKFYRTGYKYFNSKWEILKLPFRFVYIKTNHFSPNPKGRFFLNSIIPDLDFTDVLICDTEFDNEFNLITIGFAKGIDYYVFDREGLESDDDIVEYIINTCAYLIFKAFDGDKKCLFKSLDLPKSVLHKFIDLKALCDYVTFKRYNYPKGLQLMSRGIRRFSMEINLILPPNYSNICSSTSSEKLTQHNLIDIYVINLFFEQYIAYRFQNIFTFTIKPNMKKVTIFYPWIITRDQLCYIRSDLRKKIIPINHTYKSLPVITLKDIKFKAFTKPDKKVLIHMLILSSDKLFGTYLCTHDDIIWFSDDSFDCGLKND